MNPLTLLRAMNGIHEEDVIMAGKHYYEKDKKTVPIRAKRLVAFAVAAVLMLSLGIAAYATYNAVSTPEAAEKVAREQIAQWRELGLLNPKVQFEGEADAVVEIEEEQGGSAWYGRLFPHSFDVRWYFGDRKYGCNLNIDTLGGKIMYLDLFADADEDAVPTGEIELTVGPDGETKTFYYYENFDDLLPADQTVDGFCKALAGYWGYGGYRLADRGDPVYTEDYAACFASVDGSTRMLDVPWDMSGRCSLAVYFDGDAEGAPMYIEIMQYPGYVGMDVGIRHPVG